MMAPRAEAFDLPDRIVKALSRGCFLMSLKSKLSTDASVRADKAGKAPRAVTLDMVARAAGVSASTVSRILNGTAVVSDDKKKTINDAIEKLGFIPNPVARGLAGGRTFSVGVLTQTLDSPFYGAALRGIEESLRGTGYSPLYVSGHWDAVEESRCINLLRSRRVDGIIVLTGGLSDQALRLCARTLPLVVTGRALKAPGLYSLLFDDFGGGQLATQHLIELGHRRIAFISGDNAHPDSIARHAGYRAALEAAGIAYDPALVVPGLYTEDSGLEAVENLLTSGEKFSAIFAANDQMAVGASLGLYRRSMKVPHDISVIGFDDAQFSAYTHPPLSTIHQPMLELGRLAAQALLQMLQGQKPTAKVPAPRLVERESTRKI
jgi:LacI family transcriptional regulator